MTYAQHPLSAAFPAMSVDDQQALTDDIETNGQREPIVLFEGKVIDGWHRYQSCLSLGLKPKETKLPKDEDPIAFVKSCNLHRRHLSASQRAAAVVACSAWVPATIGRPRGEPGSPLEIESAVSNAQMAKEADTSVRSIQQAKIAHAAGLGAAVRDGKVTVKRAAEVAKLPVKERKAALEEPRIKTAAQKISDDANDDFDPVAELERMGKVLATAQAEVKALEADDQKAETLKWQRAHQVAERRQGELMDAAAQVQRHVKFLAGQLARCGRAVGETDTDKIAPTVEAFVRKHSKVAA